MSPKLSLLIYCGDEQTASVIHQSLPAELAGDIALTSRRALDGDMATWMLIGTLATTNLKVVLNSILTLVQLRQVRSIKVGEVEVHNPSRADVERLLTHIEGAGLADTLGHNTSKSGSDAQ